MYKFVMGYAKDTPDNVVVILAMNDNMIAHAQLVHQYLGTDSVVTYAGFASFGSSGKASAYGHSVSVSVGTEGLDQEYFNNFIAHALCRKYVSVLSSFTTRDIFVLNHLDHLDPEEFIAPRVVMAQGDKVCSYLNQYYTDNVR